MMYQKSCFREVRPDPSIEHIDDLFKAKHVRRILDLGCGEGRHLIFLGKLGYEMSGFDCALPALEFSRQWLNHDGLQAELKHGDMSKLPWPDEYFDAVISIKVINHHTRDLLRKTFDEVYRVLRSGGYFLATAMKEPPPKDWKTGKFVKIMPHTYIPLVGDEKGVPHYCFTKSNLRNLLNRFEIMRWQDDAPGKHNYAFLVRKKENL
jgi:ubiquinone/menaquinone biosynthesis C-methylase UbiE